MPEIIFFVRGDGFNVVIDTETARQLSPAAARMLAPFDEPVTIARAPNGQLVFRSAQEMADAHEEPTILSREDAGRFLSWLLDAWQVDASDVTAAVVDPASAMEEERAARQRMNDPGSRRRRRGRI